MDDAIHPYIAALRSGQIPFPTILSVPLAGRFAIVRLNPVAMVEHLDDPEALAQARRMVTQKYLVFLERMPWLPLPDQPWYAYEVRPIAPTLRVQDYSRGLTSDMAIPIAPNTSHPNGRAPIQPDTRPFPFSNCYFWFRYELLLRVIPRPVERFDHSNAVALGARKTNELATQFNEDYIRSEDTAFSSWFASCGLGCAE
ncbi:hypothetical protein C8Q76DRAFT_712616 [Earliella scabrosa]|nr:hypothetical protein C8Q76DRAFT_712616 [Earliella scabrosa]